VKFELLTFELPKKTWTKSVIEGYEKKIQPFVPFEVRSLKASAQPRKNAQESKRLSTQLMMGALDSSAMTIVFDERGKSLDSHGFAKILNQALESGKQKVQWVIGGPYGLEEGFRKRCDFRISLSPLVMNQEVAVTVALEQIYRAFTIRNNLPYHNT